MFAYCNDNPVNSVDQDGSKSVATLLLELWINGEGEAQTFEEGSFVAATTHAVIPIVSSEAPLTKVSQLKLPCWIFCPRDGNWNTVLLGGIYFI